MKKTDEKELIEAYESGEWISESPSKAEKDKFKAAAQATFVKDRRVNIRLASPDLWIFKRVHWKKASRIKLLLQASYTNSSAAG